MYFSPWVQVPGVRGSGNAASLTFPLTVTIDLSAVPAGTTATLFFDLVGFGPADSHVTVDDVTLRS